MENQPIRGLGGLFKRCVSFCFSLNEYRGFKYFLQMADEWSCISHVLEREEEEFQAATRAEAGATPLCTNDLDKTELFMYLLMLFTQ